MSDPGASRLDIVIPVFNEGENILPVLETLDERVKTPFRVLICYDFEEDTTLKALEGYRHPERVLRVRNEARGPHRAILTGFKASAARAVLVFPADDTLNAGIIDELVRKIEEGCEIAAPSRFMPGGRMDGCPWLKAFLVRAASRTLRLFARLPVRDASNGFRMFSRRVLDGIPIQSARGFTYSIELLVKCHRLGWPVAEVPSRWKERERGQSRFKVLRWMFPYLRWYFYAFATTWLFRRRVAGVSDEVRKGAARPSPAAGSSP